MKEIAIQKINKIGKVTYVLGQVARGILIAGVILCLIGMVLLSRIPDAGFHMVLTQDVRVQMDEEMRPWMEHMTFTLNNQEVDMSSLMETEDGYVLEGGMELYDFSSGIFMLMLTLWIVFSLITIVVVTFFIDLCKGFRDCQSPFQENIIDKMVRFSYSLIPWAIVNGISSSMIENFANGQFGITFTINLETVIAVLLVVILVQIFKYGAVLQQESDETL